MPRLIVLGSPGSGRSTFAYEMSGLDPIKTRFDSYAVAETPEDVFRMARGSESAIVLLIDYPRFKQDPTYRGDVQTKADSLRKKGLKFVVVANKINNVEDSPSSAKGALAQSFPSEVSFVYDSAQSVVDRLPGPGGEIARRAVLMLSQPKAVNLLDLSEEQTMRLTRAGKTKPDLERAKADISSALTSPTNTNPPSSVEVTGPWGMGLKASGPVAYPFVVILSFVLVFFTINQLLPNVKDLFTQGIFLLAVLVGMGLLIFVWVQSNRLVKSSGTPAN